MYINVVWQLRMYVGKGQLTSLNSTEPFSTLKVC
jgi:hypothetical protein